MPLTIVATPGAVDANSYCTRAEATTFHASRLYATAWTGASTGDQDIALVMATRELDLRYEWAGWAATDTQALQWPRTGVVDGKRWSTIASTVIPQELKNATAEYARQLLVADRTLDSDIETQKITSIGAGPVSLTFADGVRAKPIPDAVMAMLYPWWGYLRGRTGTRELVRA